MLEKLWNLLRPHKPLVVETKIEPRQIPPQPSSTAAPPRAPQAATTRDHDDDAWERYEDREIAGEYSWTYDGTTVRYRDTSWQYHEPDTYRPKKVNERFYNELSPDHVDQMLAKCNDASQKARVRERLEEAAHVAYMRRKQSDEARALAELLTRQCIETYKQRCSTRVFQWRAKFLVEQGLATAAVQLLMQRLEICTNDAEREPLLKALHQAERKSEPR